MKKLIFILSLGLIFGMTNINKADAQVHVSINIDVQPAWGPSGYNYAEFYYIPEINVYYDVVGQMFYYNNRGRWISSIFLPVAYSRYDFYSLYKVVLNGVYHPWNYNRRHVNLYAGYRYNYAQMPIYYMTGPSYHRARINYHGWVEPRYMPRNHGRPNNRDYSMNTRNGRINDTRSPAPNNRRDVVSNSRSSRNDATVNSRSSNRSDNRNSPAVNNSRSSDNKNKPAVNNSRNNRNNDTSVRSSSNDNKKNPAVGSSRSNSRSNDSSVRSSSRSSENKSSSRSAREGGSTGNRENSRSARR